MTLLNYWWEQKHYFRVKLNTRQNNGNYVMCVTAKDSNSLGVATLWRNEAAVSSRSSSLLASNDDDIPDSSETKKKTQTLGEAIWRH